MPAEWQPHAATHLAWPFDDTLWVGYLAGVRREFTQLVATTSSFEPVILHVRDEEAAGDARRRLARAEANFSNICFHPLPLNDIWLRDNGPLFIRNPAGEVALTDWTFNAWGGKYSPWDADDRAPRIIAEWLGMKRFEGPLVLEGGALELNARGVCLTTRSCLLNPNRNPGRSQEEIEEILHAYLGVKHVVWLERGLEGDHTDGHIDTLARFTDDHTLVCATCEDEDDPNFEVTQENLETLQTLRDAEGNPYHVVELPLPEKRLELAGVRLPLTYANFYIGNGFVLAPLYDDVNDERALDILGPLFPERKVTGLPAQNIITGGGAFHCLTQQQPEGEVYRG
jgi:agmatine deiminase